MYFFDRITFNPRDSNYDVTFAGVTIETTVTKKAATATQWVREITAMYAGRRPIPTAVGLDVEWLRYPTPHTRNKSATLQLCISRKCLILQLFYMDEIPRSIKAFLRNPNFTFVGIEVVDHVSKLKNEYGLGCSKHVDVRAAAETRWPGRFSRVSGLKDLALGVCRLRMKKPNNVCLSMSDWQARVLTEEQIEYACIDAFVSYKLGHTLLDY